MFQCKVKGIHIAERDTQTIGKTKPTNEFWNTYNLLRKIISNLCILGSRICFDIHFEMILLFHNVLNVWRLYSFIWIEC